MADTIDQHLARKALCTTRGSATDGKDITVILPWRIPSPNGIEIDTAIV